MYRIESRGRKIQHIDSSKPLANVCGLYIFFIFRCFVGKNPMWDESTQFRLDWIRTGMSYYQSPCNYTNIYISKHVWVIKVLVSDALIPSHSNIVGLTIASDFMSQFWLFPKDGKSIKFYRRPEIMWHLTFNSPRWYHYEKPPHIRCVQHSNYTPTNYSFSAPHFVCRHAYSCHLPNSDMKLKETY